MTENPLSVQPVRKLIWKYALPGIVSQLVNSAHNIVDQIFIGWGINDLGIAATNVIFPLTTLMTAISALVGMGAAARFSILLGEKRQRDAAQFLGNAITLLVLASVILTAGFSLFLRPTLYLFGATEPIMEYAVPYARILCLGIPFGIFSAGMSYFIRADGNPVYSSAVLLSGAIFNIVFDPIFLFVFKMDIEGVALATVLGQVLSAALVLWYLLRRLHSVQLQSDDFRPRGRVSMTTFSLGIATFTTHILHTIAQILQTNTLKTFGALSIYGSEVPITAAGAVAKLTMVFLAAIIGIAIGSQPISGYNLGSRQYGRVKEVYRLVLRYGTIIAVSSYVILQLFPHTILQVFGSDDPLFYQFATRYIRIFLGALFLNTVQPVTSIFCTSIGKAKLGFWMALIRQGLIMIPVLLILPHFLGVDGVLFSGCFSDTVAAIVAFFVGRSQLKWLTKLEQEANA